MVFTALLGLVVTGRALSPPTRLARALLGDPTKAPLRNAVRETLKEATWGLAPTAVVDAAVDARRVHRLRHEREEPRADLRGRGSEQRAVTQPETAGQTCSTCLLCLSAFRVV